MTTDPNGDASPGISLPARVREWFWRGNALRAVRARQARERAALLRVQRARIALEVGLRALDPSSPWLAGNANHLACQLFAESIAWSLRGASLPRATESATPEKPPELAEIVGFLETQHGLLLQAAGNADALDRVSHQLRERTFETTSLGAAETERVARELSQVARRLLELTHQASPNAGDVLFERGWRLGVLLVAALGLFYEVSSLRESQELHADVAVRKPWAVSSVFDAVCNSPEHDCPQKKGYFFHTQDEPSPWLEIDLTHSERISGARVFNRRDCCAERAVPLAIEVSEDHQTWREVARKTGVFDSWRASFSPVSARWVRFRVTRRSFLHLYDVRILR
jgi:hypothetical protein